MNIQKEILVPSEDEKAEFSTISAEWLIVDDPIIFPSVVWIIDAMLRHIDPKKPHLVKYLETIDPDVYVGVPLPKGAKSSSMIVMVMKKKK